MWPLTLPSRWHFLPIDSLKPVAFFLSFFNLISALSSYSHGHFNELCPIMWFQWVWILLPAKKSEPRRSLWTWSLWDWVCSPVKQECQHLPCRSTISYSNAPPHLWHTAICRSDFCLHSEIYKWGGVEQDHGFFFSFYIITYFVYNLQPILLSSLHQFLSLFKAVFSFWFFFSAAFPSISQTVFSVIIDMSTHLVHSFIP